MTEPRLLHTMVRTKDLDASIAFYTNALGMKVLRRTEVPAGKYTLAFVGYGDEATTAVIELTYNWDQTTPYDLGTAYGHMAIGVPDITAACTAAQSAGGKVARAPGPVKHGTTIIAFLEDPDGYKIELIERR